MYWYSRVSLAWSTTLWATALYIKVVELWAKEAIFFLGKLYTSSQCTKAIDPLFHSRRKASHIEFYWLVNIVSWCKYARWEGAPCSLGEMQRARNKISSAVVQWNDRLCQWERYRHTICWLSQDYTLAILLLRRRNKSKLNETQNLPHSWGHHMREEDLKGGWVIWAGQYD